MSIGIVFYQTALLSSMILLGYGLSKAGYLQKAHTDFLTRLLLDLCIPCTVLAAGSADLGADGLDHAFGAAALFLAVMVLLLGIGQAAARLCGLDEDEALVLSRSAGYPNNGFMGLPLATAVFGAQGTIWCAFTMLSGNLYVLFAVFRSFSRGERQSGHGLKGELPFLLTPLNLSTLAMLAMLAFHWQLPAFPRQFCEMVGGCTTPLAMLVVGNLLAASRLSDTLRRPVLYLSTLLRNVLAPLCLAFFLHFLGWGANLSLCLVLLMGCSVASLVCITAGRYGRGASFASQALLQSNLFLPLTLPLVMALAQRML